jgi:TolB-like protein
LAVERPTIAVLPFDLIGPGARCAAGLPEEIVVAIWRLHCMNVITASQARYHLRGSG